ncbi:MAG: nucleoside-triphosphatase [Terriglobia bacterium]
MAGLNLLVTGRPGVGKTALLERVLEQLRGSLRLAVLTTAEERGPSGLSPGERLGTNTRRTNKREERLPHLEVKGEVL